MLLTITHKISKDIEKPLPQPPVIGSTSSPSNSSVINCYKLCEENDTWQRRLYNNANK